MDLNKVMFSGRLGQDPRVRQLDDGTPVLNLSVAMSRRKKGEDVTYWWDVTMFGQRGLKLHDMLRKGSHVIVDGEYGEREYTDKNGVHRVQREVLARDIYLLDRKQDGDRQGQGQSYGQQRQASGDAFGGARSRPTHQGGYGSGYGSGGKHRDDFAAGGRNQQQLPHNGTDYGPPPTDDEIPF